MAAVELEDNIWIAASDGKLDLVKAFVASGVAVNAQDENGYSAIHAAASWGEFSFFAVYKLAETTQPLGVSESYTSRPGHSHCGKYRENLPGFLEVHLLLPQATVMC